MPKVREERSGLSGPMAVSGPMMKSGEGDRYNDEFQAIVNRGAIREVAVDELEEWKRKGGAVNFISHHSVTKETSTTTPLRIVWNSSQKKL